MSFWDTRSRIGALYRSLRDAHEDPAAFITQVLRECGSAAGADRTALLHVLGAEAFVAFAGDAALLGMRVDLPPAPAALGARTATQREFAAANRRWLLVLGSQSSTEIDPHQPLVDEVLSLLCVLLERTYEGELRGSRNDELTGLPDRPSTMARLTQAIAGATRTATNAALLFLDLDGFKKVNDSFGHARGDDVLRNIAGHLRRALRTDEFLGRIGGDEFSVVLPSVSHADEAAQVAERLCAAVRESAVEQEIDELVSLSVGIALYPAHARTCEEWLAHADAAMYRAKRSGSGYCTYDRDWTSELPLSSGAAVNMATADVEHEFLLCFQPIFHIATGRIHGAEAFVRWLHPQAGMLSPAQFIESTRWRGTAKLDAWVVREAVRYAAKWRRAYGVERLYVNVAVPNEAAASLILGMLDGIDPLERSAIALELNMPATAGHESLPGVVDRIAGSGVSVGIDDFEVKTFSLDVLAQLHVNFIKMSYDAVAAGTPQAKSLEAALALSKIFNWSTIVAKIDNAFDVDVLRRHGAAYVQGFAFAQPLTAPDFQAWLEHNRPGEAIAPRH